MFECRVDEVPRRVRSAGQPPQEQRGSGGTASIAEQGLQPGAGEVVVDREGPDD